MPSPPKRAVRAAVLAAMVVLGTLVGPRTLAGWDAHAWYAGDLNTQDRLARTVAAAVLAQSGRTAYHTGEERFDGQATVALHQMALLGLGQILLEHPEKRAAYLPAMHRAAEHLLDPATLVYAQRFYGKNEDLLAAEGQAYLGYVNMGLGMLRLVEPEMPFGRQHDRLSDELARRMLVAPSGVIETYPNETWPPDVAAVIGSIGLHARLTKRNRDELFKRWEERFEKCAIAPSGLLVQRVDSHGCKPLDAPRGSGTALAAYFLSFATPALARRLYDALAAQSAVSLLGFGGIREYPPGSSGHGDVNAGPILFGVSVGATGFALGAARAHGDRTRFVELYRLASLFGVPVEIDGRTAFAMGGALGNALLLAMLTARPLGSTP